MPLALWAILYSVGTIVVTIGAINLLLWLIQTAKGML